MALDEIESRFAGQIEEREAITFETASASLARAPSPPARRIDFERASTSQLRRMPKRTDCWPRESPDLGIGKLPWSKAQLQFRNRVNFLRGPKVTNGRICPMKHWRAQQPNGLRPFLDGKTALSQIGADDLAAALDSLDAVEFAPAPRRRGADPFQRAVRLACADRL